MKKTRKSIWVQIVLANKYGNEFLKSGILRKYSLTSHDYFLLMSLGEFENLNFYELNKYMPIDVKSLHQKVNTFVDKDLISREYDKKGASILNLTDKARKIINEVYINNLDETEGYFEEKELLDIYSKLYEFNKKMRKILELKLSESTLNKINIELL